MATVTGYTAARMLEIENETIVNASLDGDNLILVTREGTEIDVGSVRGSIGPTGSTGAAGAGIAVGMLGNFPKSTLPSGWLNCDGSTKSIATYPDLAAYLGTDYGGNGTTTFGLPSYAGRVMVGFDSTQSEFDSMGEAGGANTVVLTTSTMPTHTHSHTLAAPNHTHNLQHYHTNATPGWSIVSNRSGGAGAGIYSGGIGGAAEASTAYANVNDTGGASATALTGSIANAGSGAAHANLQPYRVVTVGIYAGV
jgi:microcystin-dependent protein